VRQRLADLRRMERTLASLVQACGCAHGTVSCPMIAALQSS
jgi:MerR family mercuric resistance operon transcriptional regulator